MESTDTALQTDVLSPLAHELLKLNSPIAYTRLVVDSRGPADMKTKLQTLKPEQLITKKISSPDDAQSLLSGLWLWHDFLDESHTISQGIESSTGSFWHAIMHRREGDFSNSKYWFAKVGRHPMLQAIAPRAAALIHPLPADKSLLRLIRDGWDASAFVDFCEQLHRTPEAPNYRIAVELQKIEWRLLFDHCARAAIS